LSTWVTAYRCSSIAKRTRPPICSLVVSACFKGSSEDALVESEIRAGEAWRNEPGVVHSIEALEESVVLEVSTTHLDDVVRIRDHYGRVDSS
jgi:hypothetical protein